MTDGANEFLTHHDMLALTGSIVLCDQCAELTRRGIPFIEGAKGRPLVPRHFIRTLACQTVGREQVPAGSVEPTAPINHQPDASLVTIAEMAELTGYSEGAIRAKIYKGVWVEGRELVRIGDGRVLISLEGYRRWVRSGPSPVKRGK